MTDEISTPSRNTPARRIVCLVGAVMSKICSGTIYASSLWSTQLASKFGFTQSQVATIVSTGIACFFISGPLVGYVVDKLKQPTPILLLAAFLVPVGNVLLGMMYRQTLHGSYLAAAMFFGLVGLGSSFGSHGSLAPTVRNFPETQAGIVVAIPISAFAISTFLFATLARMAFVDLPEPGKRKKVLDVGSFLITVGIISFVGYMIAAVCVKDLRGERRRRRRSSMEADLQRIAETARHATLRGVRPKVLMPTERPRRLWDWLLSFTRKPQSAETQPLTPKVPSEKDSYLLSHVCELPTVLWLSSFLILAGTGLQYINSVSSILLSLSPRAYTPQTPTLQKNQAYHVALVSLLSFFGRIFTGICTDIAKRWKIRRVTFYVFSNCLMLLAQLHGAANVSALADSAKSSQSGNGVLRSWTVVSLTAMIGFAYGTLFVLGPTICTNLYGTRHFAANWGAQAALVAVGGILFTHLYSHIYDLHNPHQLQGHKMRRTCRGSECFRTSFIINAAACGVALLFSILLWSVTKEDERMSDFREDGPLLPTLQLIDEEGLEQQIEVNDPLDEDTHGISPTGEETLQKKAVLG